MAPFFLLIYINDLAKNLLTNPKLFADDTFIFSVMSDLNTSSNEINDDLKKIGAWPHQSKLSFNPDCLKEVQEVLLSQKRNKPHNSDTVFNGNSVKKSSYKKQLGFLTY